MFDALESELANIIKRKNPNVSYNEIRNWMDSQNYWANWNNSNSREWIEELIQNLDKEKNQINIYRFFTLIAGIFIDLTPSISRKLDLMKDRNENIKTTIKKKITNNMQMRNYLLTLADIYEDLEALNLLFNDELVFAIIFFRNKNAHPVLDGYKVKLRKNITMDAKKYAAFLKISPFDELDIFENSYQILVTNRTLIDSIATGFRTLITT